jgi:membrane protein implicated in regulation of membrane protease activity
MKPSGVLLGFSFILIVLGGYADMIDQRLFGLTREHYWSDGIYFAILAIAAHLLWRL